MWTNPWFIGLIVIILIGHVIWFIHFALKTLKGTQSPTTERKEDGIQTRQD